LTASLFSSALYAAAQDEAISRGRYLVVTSGCNDCHTPSYPEQAGQVPESAWLVGNSTGFKGPWGTSYPANLRISAAQMTEQQFVARARSEMLPPMPWFNLKTMSDADMSAIYQYIRSLGQAGTPAPAYVPPGSEPSTPYIVFVPQESQGQGTKPQKVAAK